MASKASRRTSSLASRCASRGNSKRTSPSCPRTASNRRSSRPFLSKEHGAFRRGRTRTKARRSTSACCTILYLQAFSGNKSAWPSSSAHTATAKHKYCILVPGWLRASPASTKRRPRRTARRIASSKRRISGNLTAFPNRTLRRRGDTLRARSSSRTLRPFQSFWIRNTALASRHRWRSRVRSLAT